MSSLSTARDWSRFLGWVLELIAIAALAATHEVSFKFFLAGAMIVAASVAVRRELPDQWVVGLLLSTIVTTIVIWRTSSLHPIVAVAHAAPIAHAFLWFAKADARYRGWRLGMGMVELILASSLSSEAYLPLTIMIFLILSSVALSCNFLDEELRREAPSYVDNPLPARYIRQSLGISLLLVACSVVIFPILPRTPASLQLLGSPAVTGYTEGVRVSEFQTFDTNQSGSVILRMYPSGKEDLLTEIHLGLLRGRALDRFDGKEWKPSSERRALPPSRESAGPPARLSVEATRESMRSDALPVPYGTSNVSVSYGSVQTQANATSMGEWIAPGSHSRRVSFQFDLVANDLRYLKRQAERDAPRPHHTDVPEDAATPALKREAQKIFAGARNTAEKLAQLTSYFQSSKFSVGVPSPEEAEARSELTRNLNGIEEFLFVRKTGHCEWYASASAVLLRLSGVPTRLVAGFRLSKGQVGGVLSVRSSDAHAWVEAWSPERGWIPFDPTPRVMSSSPFEVFSDAYDWLSAYWFKWVVSYDMGDFTSEVAKSVRENLSLSRLQEASLESIANQKGLIVGALFGALALGGAVLLVLRIWFPQFFSIRWRVHEGPPVLRRERLRMERMLRRAQIPAEEFEQTRHLVYRARGAQAGDLFTEWLGTYQSARFGRTTTPLDDTARVLNEKYLRFKRSVTN